jgi:RNA polymerase sigma-70 factor (ECF subfamily)
LEEAAFEGLFRQYYLQVYRIIFRLVGDPTEAQDLTAETFCKLWREPPSRLENPGGWLHRVATRLGLNALRAERRRAAHENESARQVLASAPPADPGREAERADERARVRATLDRMRERDAQLLILRYSGLSYKELAAALGISANSVGTLLVRAEKEFERAYSEGGSDAPRR